MATLLSEPALIRGADGRLYAISAAGASIVADGSSMTINAASRSGAQAGYNAMDHEASRTTIVPRG